MKISKEGSLTMKLHRIIVVGLFIIIILSLVTGCTSDSRPSTGRIELQNGDVELAGNLFIPAGEGPFPAIVFVHGAGKYTSQDYKYLSFFFVNHGFATLTYDKRGVGASSDSYKRVGIESGEAVLEDLAGDAIAGVKFLKSNNQIDPNKIGFFGISQADWIAPLAASKSSDIAFIVLYSGPVCTVGQEIYYSQTTGDDPGEQVEGISLEKASNMARDYTGPHGFDPLHSLEAIDIPGLWMFGSQDRSIPIPLSIDNLDTLVAQQGKDFDHIVYPNADHSLRDVNTEQFFPAMSDAANWILEKFGD
ncbi:alpha/beta hydrolase family protein [Chloroflexota bacterium]